MRNNILIFFLFALIALLIMNVTKCERNTLVNNIHDTIQVISKFRDTAKVEVTKWKIVLKQGRDRIIHDTLKCDSVYILAMKQDTLIRIDSILIEKYVYLSRLNQKTIDSLTKDKKGRWKAFKKGFGVGFVSGALIGIAIKR